MLLGSLSSEFGIQIKSIRHLPSCNKAKWQVTVSPDQWFQQSCSVHSMWNVRLCPKKGTFDTLFVYALNPFPSSISVSGFLSHLCLKIPIHFPRIVQRLKQPCKMDQSKEWQNCHQLEDTWGSVGKIPSYIVKCIAGKIDYGALLENVSSKTLE